MPEPSRSIRCAHGPAVRAGDQPRAQIFAPVRLLSHDEIRGHEKRARLGPAAAAERDQQRPGKAQEADHGGDRIARQPDEHRAPEPPEGERPAGLHRDLPEMQLAEAVHGAHHVVLVAARGAARGDQRIAFGRGLAQGLCHRLRPIGQDAEIGDPAAEACEQPEQDRAVGIVGLAGPSGAPGSRSSSPVENSATSSGRKTSSAARPKVAATPTSCGRSRMPAAAPPARAHVLAGPAPVGAALDAGAGSPRCRPAARRPPASARYRRPRASARRSAP